MPNLHIVGKCLKDIMGVWLAYDFWEASVYSRNRSVIARNLEKGVEIKLARMEVYFLSIVVHPS